MKVLNLYAGIGGNRKLWDNVEVTAVELDKQIAQIYQDLFPDDEVIITDAHQHLLDNFEEYDFIWSSPPCPSHSRLRTLMHGQKKNKQEYKYPDMKLYEEIIFLDNWFEGLYCIENVISYYDPLIKPQEIGRHYYWSNFIIRDKKMVASRIKNNTGYKDLQNKLGFNLDKYNYPDKRKLLRNCVEPKMGKIILESARGNTQQTLSSMILVSKKQTQDETSVTSKSDKLRSNTSEENILK